MSGGLPLPPEAILELSPATTVVVDDRWQVAYWSPAAGRLYGWSEDEVIGRSVTDVLIPRQKQNEARDILENLARSGSWTGRFCVQRKNGEQFDLQLELAAVVDDDGRLLGVIGNGIDVSEHVRAEAELQQREAFVRSVNETIPSLIYIYDLQHERNVWSNQKVPSGRGAPQDARRLQILNLVHEDDIPALKERGRRMVREDKPRVHELEYRLLDSDNRYRWYLDRARVFERDEQGRVTLILGVATDISALKEAEERTRYSEIRYRRMLEHMPMAFVNVEQIRRPGHAKSDYRLLDVNPTFEREAGVKRDEVIGKLASEVFDQLEDFWFDYADELLRTGKPVQIMRHVMPSDRYIEVHSYSPQGGRIASFFQDVTDRVRDRKALERSEKLLTQTGEMARIGGWELDVERDMVEWTNTTALIHERPGIREIDGDTAISYYEPAYRDLVLASIRNAVEGERFTIEAKLRTATDRVLWVRVRGEPVRQGEDVVCVAGTFQDITAEKQAEREKRIAEEKAWQTQKLESLGVLAGGIAHDFNNLLVGILGNADLVREDLGPDHPTLEFVDDIVRAAGRAASLSHQMLLYSGRAGVEIQQLDLNELVHRHTQVLRSTVGRDNTLTIGLGENLPRVRGDGAQLRQVLINLVLNAAEAIGDEQGNVAVTTGVRHCDEAYLNAHYLSDSLAPGHYVYLEVSDDGPGMDEATVDKIFDPFFTTKFTGRGLGLAAVLGIVRGHNGAVRVNSSPGDGTAVRLMLPVDMPAHDHVEGGEGDSDTRRLVLVADGNTSVRTVAVRMLAKMGLRAVPVADGDELIMHFREHAGDVGLVLLDMALAHNGGDDLVDELRELDGRVKVLICSGYAEPNVLRRFDEAGVAGAIQKPFTYDVLRSKVMSMLEG